MCKAHSEENKAKDAIKQALIMYATACYTHSVNGMEIIIIFMNIVCAVAQPDIDAWQYTRQPKLPSEGHNERFLLAQIKPP